ncbi:hypothetical protein B0H12DRAFT_1234817 [Mycena haematopus]|nr:hypothetical protein B0H12DRAFT_1234817 [Mycena haematopus]
MPKEKNSAPVTPRNKSNPKVSEYLDVEAKEDNMDEEDDNEQEELDEEDGEFIDDSGLNDDETAIHWEASPGPGDGDGGEAESADDDEEHEDYVISTANHTRGLSSASVAPGPTKPARQTQLQIKRAEVKQPTITLSEEDFSAFERFKAAEEKKRKTAAARKEQTVHNTRSAARTDVNDDTRSSTTVDSADPSLKNQKPVTPAPDLTKFNSAKAGSKSEVDSKSKGKRKRTTSDSGDKRQLIGPDLSKFNANKSAGEAPSVKKKSKGAPKTTPDEADDDTETNGKQIKKQTVLETKNARKPRPSPKICQVMDPEVQDAMLKPVYEAGLPNLERGRFIAWNQKRGPGMFLPSDLGTINPSINIGSVWSFLNFVSKGRFVNLARVAPDDLEATYLILGNEDKRWTLSQNGESAHCLTVAIITASSLTEVKSDSGNAGPTVPLSRHVQARFPCQEFDRVASMCTMVFNQNTLHAQLNEDALTISTRTVTANKLRDDSKPWASGGIRSASSSYKSSYVNADALPYTAEVPVYDGRKGTLDAYQVLDNLDRLDQYDKRDGEIEENSCAVACAPNSERRTRVASTHHERVLGTWAQSCDLIVSTVRRGDSVASAMGMKSELKTRQCDPYRLEKAMRMSYR